MITHWDEVDGTRRERGHIAATWRSLTGSNSVTVGVKRITIEPGRWSTPLHLEGSEEEIFYVLAGDGISVQDDGNGLERYAVRAGDCLVHLPLEHAHTLQAGDGGLDVLAFGQRHYAANTLLPRAGVSWLGPTWVLEGAAEDHPWDREAAVGAPEPGPLADRPGRIVHVDDVDEFERIGATVARRGRDLGRAAGSCRTGIKVYDVLPSKLMNAPHSHSAEEEVFVVLEGLRHDRGVAASSRRLRSRELARWPRAACSARGPHDCDSCRSGTAAQRPRGRRGVARAGLRHARSE